MKEIALNLISIMDHVVQIEEIGLVLGGYATIALAIITFFYMLSTKKMAKVMSDQITANIKLTDVKINSSFLDEPRMRELKDNPSRLDKTNLDYMVSFFVRNSGAGNGSIDKPLLVIRLPDAEEILLKPETKQTEARPPIKDRFMTINTNIEHDLGGTIFLHGGESIRVELEYDLWTDELTIQQRQAIIKDYKRAKYYIKYKDNIDKEYFEEIEQTYINEDEL